MNKLTLGVSWKPTGWMLFDATSVARSLLQHRLALPVRVEWILLGANFLLSPCNHNNQAKNKMNANLLTVNSASAAMFTLLPVAVSAAIAASR